MESDPGYIANLFLSTPSARRATAAAVCRSLQFVISIHALREEGDRCPAGSGLRESISIHALREEGDHCKTVLGLLDSNFYPRPPRGGRPDDIMELGLKLMDFYPRPPRGGRRLIVFYNFNEELFLSTPSARRATFSKYLWGCCVEFLSTPSARRATSFRWSCIRRKVISIHALREEGDCSSGSKSSE